MLVFFYRPQNTYENVDRSKLFAILKTDANKLEKDF